MSPIAEYRKAHELTQSDLSTLAGVSRPELSLMETGQLPMSKNLIAFFENHDATIIKTQADYAKARTRAIRQKVAA
jgi:transcriptional regulator with XRE-family HTH domain